MALTQKSNLFIGEGYDQTLTESMHQLVSEIQNKTLNLSHFLNLFYQLMQSRLDPPLESIWVYSALSFKTKKAANDDLSSQILIARELLRLISGCSGPCSASKSITLLAPLVSQVYKLVVDLLGKDLADKRARREIKKVKSLIGDSLGYVSVCCSKNMSKESELVLNVSYADMVTVWTDGNGDLKAFLPLVSDEIRREISIGASTVNYFAGVVISELFLLKLCVDLRVGNRGLALDEKLRSWVVCSIAGFQNFYFFETLVRMLMEPVLPVTSLLSSEDESFVRKILYDGVILVDYSFLKPEREIDIPANQVLSLAVKRLIVTHEAIEFFRKNGDPKRAVSCTSSFSTSRLPSQIIKCVTSQIGMEEEARGLKGSSPKALIKWLLNLDDRGIIIFDDRISKRHAKLAVDGFKSDSEQQVSKPEGRMLDADLLFYIDSQGEKEDDLDEDDKETNESMSAAFVAAAKTMGLIEKGGRKRKGRRSAEKKKKIKVLKGDSSDDSDSDGERSSSVSGDGSGSESEVENPSSDEDA